MPALASTVAEVLPQQASEHLGDGTLRLLDETFFESSTLSQQRQEKLTALFQQYTDVDADYAVNILFRKGGKRLGANAMALPDGTVIFTDELVTLAEDDRELVAIFGHEIGHLAHKHSLRRVVQDSLLTLVWVLISGDASSASSVAVAMPALLLELAYSREFEREADDFAYQFMVRHQLEPRYFAAIMSRLDAQLNASASKTSSTEEPSSTEDKNLNTKDENEQVFDSNITSYLSTHPANEQRIKRFLNSPLSNSAQ